MEPDRRWRIAAAAVPLCLLAAACQAPADDGGWNRSALSTRTPEPTESPVLRRPPARPRLAESVIYERFCRRRDPLPGPLVAAFDGSRVVVVSGTGEEIARIPGRPPVRWSASGGLLAVGPHGALWTWDGRRYEGTDVPLELTSERGARWVWSPSGDCALILDDGRLNAFHTGAGANTVTLLPRGVEAAAWGPDALVAVVMRERSRRSLWIADLAGSRLLQLVAFPPDACCVVLAGWVRERDQILFWVGSGNSKVGWRLQSVDLHGRRRTWGWTRPRPDAVAPCGDSLVALTGSDVSLLRPNVPRRDLAGPARFTGLGCSSDGSYVVAAGSAGLTLYSTDGSRSIVMDAAPGITPWVPEWGPPGSGVLFVRTSAGGAALWFLPEGGVNPRFVVRLGRPSSRRAFDWTATDPSGLLRAAS